MADKEYRKEDYVCGINFDDPAQTTHQLKPIPVNTQTKFDSVRALAIEAYEENDGPKWDADMDQQLEARVKGGLEIDEILRQTRKDRKRKDNTPGKE